MGGYYLLQQLAYSAAAQVKSRINVIPKRIQVRFSWNTPTFIFLDLTFQVENNNQVGGTADGFEGTLYYGSTRMGDISLSGPLTLPAESVSDVLMTARVSLEDLPIEIVTMITTGQFLGTLRVKGVLYTSYINIPIDENVPIA